MGVRQNLRHIALVYGSPCFSPECFFKLFNCFFVAHTPAHTIVRFEDTVSQRISGAYPANFFIFQ